MVSTLLINQGIIYQDTQGLTMVTTLGFTMVEPRLRANTYIWLHSTKADKVKKEEMYKVHISLPIHFGAKTYSQRIKYK